MPLADAGEKSPSLRTVAAVSVVAGFVYPWIVVAAAPDRCEGACTLVWAYAPAPLWALGVALVVAARGSALRGLWFGAVGAVLGLAAAFLTVLILLDISGAT